MAVVSTSPAVRPLPTALFALGLALALSPAARAANDLAVTEVASPAQAIVGHAFTVQVTLENHGTTRLSGYPLGIYFSPSTSLSVFDPELGSAAGPDLSPGDDATVELTGTIPDGTALGSYTVGVIADPMNTLGEAPATLLDNVKGGTPRTKVVAPAPDFVAEQLTWGVKAAAGEVVPVELVATNKGVVGGEASASIYLSTNDTISTHDQLVGSVVLSLDPGEEVDEIGYVKLPSNLAPATYFLGLWIDPANEVNELDKTNDLAVSNPADVLGASLAMETTFLPDAMVGVPYVKSLVASGGDGPYAWSLAGGHLPAGLSLSEDGLVSGTPTEAGTFSPVVKVTSGQSSASEAFILHAVLPTTSLEVTSTELPPAVIGNDYTAPLAAVGGTAPYRWQVVSGRLPAGLSLSDDGVISGRATTEESQSFRVEARDVSGTAAVRDLTLEAVATRSMSIQQLVLDDATAGEAYLAKLDPDGGASPYVWSLASGRLPAGLAFAADGDSATLTGKATETGDFVFAVRLEDASGQVDRKDYVLHVMPASVQVLTAQLPDATRGEAYDEELSSTARTASWSIASGELPPGFELSTDGHVRATGGKVAATAPLRTYTFLVQVTDGQGGLGVAGMSIAVLAPPQGPASTGGCAGAGATLLALLPLVMLLRRRRVAGALALGLVLFVASPARATSFGYGLHQAPEDHYPELGSVWLDDVSMTALSLPGGAADGGTDVDAGDPADADGGSIGDVDGGSAPAATVAVSDGDFSDLGDDFVKSTSPWQVETSKDLGDHAWMSCAHDPATGATAAPSARCLFDFGDTQATDAGQFQLTQAVGDVVLGGSYEVKYCLKGSAPGQTAKVGLVATDGTSLGFDAGVTLGMDQFGCETHDFTATASGPATLAFSLGDPAAEVHSIGDFANPGGRYSALDQGVVTLTLPFAFTEFGQTHTQVNVQTDGLVSFADDTRVGTNTDLPAAAEPNGVFAPWWDDILTAALPATPAVPSDDVRWKVDGVAPNRVVTIEWFGVKHYPGSGTALTFQLRLFEDQHAEMHYRETTGISGSWTATVGIESDDGSMGNLALACGSSCGLPDFPGGEVIRYVPGADLQVTTLTTPDVAHAELPTSFTLGLANTGALAAANVTAKVVLSTDTTVDDADQVIWTAGPVDLDHWESKSFTNPAVVIPASVAPGIYYPIAVVDPDGAVAELDETNNVKVGSPIRVGAPAADFSAANFTLDETTLAPGGSATATVTVSNHGNLAGTCPWRIVLSLNDVLSIADRTLAQGSMDLDPGASQLLTETITLPSDLAPGTYRAGIVLNEEPAPATPTPEIDAFDDVALGAEPLTVAGGPAITTTSLPDATAGTWYAFRLAASGGDGLYLWALQQGSHLPAGLSLSPFGDLEGVPTAAGDATFTVQLTTGQGDVKTQALSLHVGDPALQLDFVSTELPAAIYGREYETRLVASGGSPPYVFAFQPAADAPGLPAGLAFDATGLIGGVPVGSGDFTLPFTVTDAAGKSASRDLVLHVLPPGRPVIDAAPLPEAELSSTYTAQLAAAGGQEPYVWKLERVRLLGEGDVATSDLPTVPGLAFDPSGSLAGTPTQVGAYALIVKVTDASGAFARDTLLLTVRSSEGLSILTTELPPATVGKAYDEQIVAAGGDGQLSFTLVGTAALPPGLALRPDGRVAGNASAPGRRTVIVAVHDGSGRDDLRAVSVEAKSPPPPRQAATGCSSAGTGAAALILLALFAISRRRRSIALAVLALGFCSFATSCGTPPVQTLCAGVSCQPGEQCDEADGICKCGGAGGRACTSEESCNPETLTCDLLDRCLLVSCERGMTCEESDGTCRCAGGDVCAANELCDTNLAACVPADRCSLVTCVGGLTCDPADGLCKCGGTSCAPGEACENGACVADKCAAASCSGGETCDPADGVCKCGGASGTACLFGQTCIPATGACVAAQRCQNVRCTGGTSCDPEDGECKCGGAGGQTCTTGQTCDLATMSCLGGDRCFNKLCPAGTACDPEDGQCHCGGTGPVCGEDEICDTSASTDVCRKLCDPVSQEPCGDTEACRYSEQTRVADCQNAGGRGEGTACSASSQCGRGLHCYAGFSSVGTCRYYCANIGGTCPGSTNTCRRLQGSDIGVCTP